MAFNELCIFSAAAFGLINFVSILLMDNKIDDLKAEINELKKEKDNA